MSDSNAGLDRAQTAKRLLSPLRASLIELLRALIQTDTTAVPPFGNETAGQLVLAEFLREQGLNAELYGIDFLAESKHAYVRQDREYAGRKNLELKLHGNGRGKSLLLNGHMDTVPPGAQNWTHGARSGHSEGDRIYGLGSFDMKGGLVAQFAVACALHRAGLRLGGDLTCASVVDEEWGGGGGTLAACLRGSTADACVIAEGTQLEIYRATRGGAVIDLTVEAGDPDNYFSGDELVSPALHLGRLLRWIATWVEHRVQVAATGAYAGFRDPTPLQVLAVESNCMGLEVPLSVPHQAAVRLYFQFLPDEEPLALLRKVRESLTQFAREDAFFATHPISWKPLYDPPLLGHEIALEHPWTRCMERNVTACLGAPAAITAAPYPCDAFLLHREFQIPTLLFGPRGAGAHNRDEWVDVESVMRTAECLLAAALEWCNG